jgi:hypothetical protein
VTAPESSATPAPGTSAAPTQPPESRTAEAIAAARERLAAGGSILDPDAGSDAPAPAVGTDAVPPETLTVRLDGLEERGEQPLEIDAPDRETYERLGRLQQEALVGRQVKADRQGIQRSRTELTELEDKIALDPAGFALDQMRETDRTEIAMQLFFQPGVLEQIEAHLQAGGYESVRDVIDDPERLRTLRAELKASSLETRDARRQQHAQHRAMEANAHRVVGEIDQLIPPDIPAWQRQQLFRDAVADVRDAARRLQLTEMQPEDVALIVNNRLRGHRLLRGAASRPSAPAPPSRAARLAGGGLPKTTAERIKLAREIGIAALVERAREAE